MSQQLYTAEHILIKTFINLGYTKATMRQWHTFARSKAIPKREAQKQHLGQKKGRSRVWAQMCVCVYLSSSSSLLVDPALTAAGGGQHTASTHTLPTKPSSDECSNITNKQTDLIRVQAVLSVSSFLFFFCPLPLSSFISLLLVFNSCLSLCFSVCRLVPLSLCRCSLFSHTETSTLPPPCLSSFSTPPSPHPHTPFTLSPVEQQSSGDPAGLPSWSNPLWQLSSCCYVVGLFGSNAAALVQPSPV